MVFNYNYNKNNLQKKRQKMNYLNFEESINFLENNNIKCLGIKIINSISELKKHTDFPYCLKLSSSILHKSEEKAIINEIFTYNKLYASYKNLKNILKKNKISGKIILQKQVDGIELIIGINEDKQFGKTIVFGTGGIFTEQINDINLKLLPINNKEIDILIKETEIYNILKGARSKKYNLKSLKELISKISKLAIKKDIKDLDLNPVIINEKNVYIVDARIGL
jgi:acyl-CoA synthetase (NDP forming)